jgi:outer membrane lipoprotein-sorting protein
VTSGRLSFEAPDTFVRETLKPSRDRLAVTGNTLTMSRGDRSRTVQLDASPEAAVIVEAIRGTLTGNRAALERLFTPTVGGSAERWTLDLVPREAACATRSRRCASAARRRWCARSRSRWPTATAR